MALLEGKADWREIFEAKFTNTGLNNKYVKIFDNPDIVYSHSDFDKDVLTDKDLILMENWAKELSLTTLATNVIDIYKECSKIKKNIYKVTTNEVLTYFNRCSWISLFRKGQLLINGFYKEFYPNITKVIATQKHMSLKDNHTGDAIAGVIDMIIEHKDYPNVPLVLDLKTAARDYEVEQLQLSPQLTLYAAMVSQELPLPIKTGYVVLSKAINKEEQGICSKCNNIKDGRHKTCNKEIDGTRCNGEWLEKIILKPQVQFIVEEKNQQQVNSLLQDFSSVLVMAKNDLTYKNVEKCHNFYGGKCAYFDLCHKGTTTGLKEKGT